MILWMISYYMMQAHAQSADLFSKVREVRQASHLSARGQADAIAFYEAKINETKNNSDRKLLLFGLGYTAYEAQIFDKSEKAFRDLLTQKSEFDEFANYYLGMIMKSNGKLKEARNYFRHVGELQPNIKTKWDAQVELADIELAEGHTKEARRLYQTLEKKMRGDERYPQVIFNLSQVEQKLHNLSAYCKWNRKLFTNYPAHNTMVDVGINGDSHCSYKIEDKRLRVRNLLWAGLSQKAQNEVDAIKKEYLKKDAVEAARIEAQFLALDGDVEQALKLLTPFQEKYKNDVSFLWQLGSTAARAGDLQLAMDSFYRAYKISPHSKNAKKALYEAAFMSYQSQDYDGAAQKFKEFSKVYARSGLSQDAKWHLAWISYLKGDYAQSYKDMSALLGTKKSKRSKKTAIQTDRVQYWMAKSLVKQGLSEKARPLFEALAKDKSGGYYGMLARMRLKQMADPSAKRSLSSEANSGRLLPFEDGELVHPLIIESAEVKVSEENETEDSVVASGSTDDEYVDSEDDAVSTSESVQIADSGEVDSDEKVTNFQNPILMKRFERARELRMLGLEESARWDLNDIEKKTSNRDYLRTLMGEYESFGNFNRSSYLAQTVFGTQRVAHGIEGVRYLWEAAYPRAYDRYVVKSAQEYTIPSELVWGIMRTESQYKRDAISPVGALGLMQVMPRTAQKVASILGEKGFTADRLMQPEWAVKIGSRYLSRLMKMYENSVPLVAASYNAGPHRVNAWLKTFGRLEMDEFVDHIPFVETRNYVKRVVSNYSIYSQLYSGKRDPLTYMISPVEIPKVEGSTTKETWEDI